jgi:hypothetical protein
MTKETQLRSIIERVLPSTIASFELRPVPASAHQAAADLYNAVDQYMACVSRNQLSASRRAAEKILLESLRTLMAYEQSAPSNVDSVKVEARGGKNAEKTRV